ncbi:MAG: DUF1846 domain-containing protein [Clostridiales bacterium]|nr:DUF1846 domain-containing protein [Clostridiales bacterium]
MEIGFDSELYLQVQSEKIEERIKMFDNKLYLEFGGKIFDDYHATRVLPGFEPDAKIKLLLKFKDDMEVIFCINSDDIEKSKIRADYGISYELELIRLIENLQKLQININSVVITMHKEGNKIEHLENLLKQKNIKVYIHKPTKGYPDNVNVIVSEEGYGENVYIPTTKKLVVVTAPGANSGKLGTCLSQLYHEYKRGVKAGYAKFETFPVWDLSLMHPVNIAYEAATAELKDVNMIDPFHLESYGINAVNYNRDISTFPILKNILLKITGKEIYKSPTDMGVNMIKKCIINEEIIKKSACDEIIRRYYNVLCAHKQGICTEETVRRVKNLMDKLELNLLDRDVVSVAINKSEKENLNAIALKLPNGKIITGKESELLSATSAAVLNAVKEITKIPDEEYLLSPSVLSGIFKMKQKTSYKTSYCLNLEEVLIALSICSITNPIIEKAINNLDKLRGCEAHSSYIIEKSELNVMKNLGVNFTCEPKM